MNDVARRPRKVLSGFCRPARRVVVVHSAHSQHLLGCWVEPLLMKPSR